MPANADGSISPVPGVLEARPPPEAEGSTVVLPPLFRHGVPRSIESPARSDAARVRLESDRRREPRRPVQLAIYMPRDRRRRSFAREVHTCTAAGGP